MLTYFKFQMKARARIFVSGRVQGVFFRDHTQKWASSLTLTGWVRNIRDGRVEALAEGDKEKIDELISKLNKGPPLSQVENVDVNWEEFKGEFKDFQVTFSALISSKLLGPHLTCLPNSCLVGV
jgi:acylphosphatase